MPSEKAYINPVILNWARRKRGLDIIEAAKKIGVNSKKLESAEKGEDYITMNQLIEASKVYKRPIIAFYFNDIPEEESLPDFRRNVDEYNGNLDCVLREFKDYKNKIEILYPNLDLNFNYDFVGSCSIDDDNNEILNKLVNLVDFDREVYEKLKDDKALNYWISKYENLGILVLQFSDISPKITRGFTFSKKPFPLIGINKNDSYYARIFTLIHEMVHIFLDQSGICDIEESNPDQIDLENKCNSIAAEFLLPSEFIWIKYPNKFKNDEDFQKIIRGISNQYKVSYSVVGYKLLDLKLLSYLRLKPFLDELEENRKKYEESKKKERKKSGGNYYNSYQYEKGKLFLSVLYKAVNRDILSEYAMMNISGLTINGFTYFQNKWETGDLNI